MYVCYFNSTYLCLDVFMRVSFLKNVKPENLVKLSGTETHIKVEGKFLLDPRFVRDRRHRSYEMKSPSDLYKLVVSRTYENYQQSPKFRLLQARCLGILLLDILCSQ